MKKYLMAFCLMTTSAFAQTAGEYLPLPSGEVLITRTNDITILKTQTNFYKTKATITAPDGEILREFEFTNSSYLLNTKGENSLAYLEPGKDGNLLKVIDLELGSLSRELAIAKGRPFLRSHPSSKEPILIVTSTKGSFSLKVYNFKTGEMIGSAGIKEALDFKEATFFETAGQLFATIAAEDSFGNLSFHSFNLTASTHLASKKAVKGVPTNLLQAPNAVMSSEGASLVVLSSNGDTYRSCKENAGSICAKAYSEGVILLNPMTLEIVKEIKASEDSNWNSRPEVIEYLGSEKIVFTTTEGSYVLSPEGETRVLPNKIQDNKIFKLQGKAFGLVKLQNAVGLLNLASESIEVKHDLPSDTCAIVSDEAIQKGNAVYVTIRRPNEFGWCHNRELLRLF